MANVSISDLGDAIVLAVKEYTEDVSQAVDKEVDATAKAALRDIKSSSPRKYGRYEKGWSIKKADSDGRTSRVIHNVTDYQLVHLLEKGHAKRGGGRVAAIPHVGPAADRHLPKMERNIARIVKGGGR